MDDVIGIDVGFGFTKATNGKEFVIFKSLFGDSTDIQFQSNFGDNTFLNNLHVTIDDKPFFVGDLAEQQSNVRQSTLNQDKLLSDFVKILSLTAAGICIDSNASSTSDINIVSGLPVGYLKRCYMQFTNMLIGKHKIIYHKPDGTNISKTINIKDIQMMPQPLGSVFNMLMNDNGKILSADIARRKIGVIDIGFRTTDITIFNNLQYIERGSSTMETGIAKSFDIIANKLRKESNVNIELFRLYSSVETGLIRIRGREYNISNLRDKVYTHLANAIANDVNRLWADDWDIDTIIITGGGSHKLSKFLQPLINGNITPNDETSDARLNNVKGYYKYGKNKWGSLIKTPEPDEKNDDDNNEEDSKENNPKARNWLKK